MRKIFVSVLFLLSLPLFNCQAHNIYGFSFPAWWHDAYDQPRSRESLKRLAETGAQWVVIIPTWHVERTKSNKILPTEGTASDESLENIIRLAKSLGLKVMLKPHVDSKTGHARALIQAQDEKIWFTHYQEMILHYARMAQRLKVEMYCVGTELYLMTYPAYTLYWRYMISEIREVYKGPLTYAANWYDIAKIEFWDLVDVIGIDAYYPLPAGPSKAGMVKNWKSFYIPNLARLARKYQKPILLTEVGIASQKGAHMKPSAYWEFGPLDLEAQKNYYEALIESFQGVPWFAGFLSWAWELNPEAGGLNDKSMTVQGKPVLEVLKNFFKGLNYPTLLQERLAQTQLPATSAALSSK